MRGLVLSLILKISRGTIDSEEGELVLDDIYFRRNSPEVQEQACSVSTSSMPEDPIWKGGSELEELQVSVEQYAPGYNSMTELWVRKRDSPHVYDELELLFDCAMDAFWTRVSLMETVRGSKNGISSSTALVERDGLSIGLVSGGKYVYQLRIRNNECEYMFKEPESLRLEMNALSRLPDSMIPEIPCIEEQDAEGIHPMTSVEAFFRSARVESVTGFDDWANPDQMRFKISCFLDTPDPVETYTGSLPLNIRARLQLRRPPPSVSQSSLLMKQNRVVASQAELVRFCHSLKTVFRATRDYIWESAMLPIPASVNRFLNKWFVTQIPTSNQLELIYKINNVFGSPSDIEKRSICNSFLCVKSFSRPVDGHPGQTANVLYIVQRAFDVTTIRVSMRVFNNDEPVTPNSPWHSSMYKISLTNKGTFWADRTLEKAIFVIENPNPPAATLYRIGIGKDRKTGRGLCYKMDKSNKVEFGIVDNGNESDNLKLCAQLWAIISQ